MAVTAPLNWDEKYYLDKNSDVRAAVASKTIQSGYEHFLEHGVKENRSFRFAETAPLPLDWSDTDYLAQNPSLEHLRAEGESNRALFDHWNKIGRFEGYKRGRDNVIENAKNTYNVPEKLLNEMYRQAQFDPSMFPDDYFSTPVTVTNLDWMAYKGRVLASFTVALEKAYLDTANFTVALEKAYLDTTTRKVEDLVAKKTFPKKHIDEKGLSIKGSLSTAPIQEQEDAIGQNYTHVFLAPWLKTGGADKAAILFANTVATQPGTRVLFLTTEMTDSPWSSKLDPSITYFDLGNFLGKPGLIPVSLSLLEQRELLAAYLLDNAPKAVHVINSHLGWFLFGKYGKALSQSINLYVSLYCYDFTIENEPVGYARYVRQVSPYLTAIFSDNTSFPVEMSMRFGIDKKLFVTTWHPSALPRNVKAMIFEPSSNAVLWASRLDRQKRPDILLSVAKACPNLTFHVYGESVMGDPEGVHFLNTIRTQHNVVYHGGYNSLNEIKRISYCAFLYTSQWDGLPNILLEFGLLGLPIVAPLIGGVGDLVTSNTGFPVTACENIAEYVNALMTISADPAAATKKVKEMQILILERHSDKCFNETLRKSGFFSNDSANTL